MRDDGILSGMTHVDAVVLRDGTRIESDEKYDVYMSATGVIADCDDGQGDWSMDEIESIIVHKPEAAPPR